MIPEGFSLMPVYVMDENGEYHELRFVEDIQPDDFTDGLCEMMLIPNNQRKYRGKKVMRWRKILRSMT